MVSIFWFQLVNENCNAYGMYGIFSWTEKINDTEIVRY